MDVLQPQLYWVGNRCYRKNPLDSSYSSFQKTASISERRAVGSYEADDLDAQDETCELEVPVEQLPSGKFRTSVSKPSALFPYIIGSKGSTKKKIENETRVTISIPKQGQHGDIVITGSDRASVIAARNRIEILSMSARKKQQFTHFLSIPVTADDIRKRFDEFKKNVLISCSNVSDIKAELFQKPEKLHLTLSVLVLLDDSERQKAAEVLESCKDRIRDIVGNNPLVLVLEGLEYMNDDPSEVDVLYGKVSSPDGSSVLQDLADYIVDRFVDSGLMERQYERVKLHVTLMNSLFQVDPDEKTRPKFNAKKILENYKNFSFGESAVQSVHLSQRFSTSSTGYYASTSQIDI